MNEVIVEVDFYVTKAREGCPDPEGLTEGRHATGLL
jgi:hypothetical protein